MNSIRLSWLTLSVAAVLSACQSDSVAPSPTSGDDPAPARVGPEVLFTDAIDRLRLGFQPVDNELRAGTDTHDAAVSGTELVMVAHHFDGARVIDGDPVRFSTVAIERGGLELAGAGGTAQLADDRSVEIDRGAATEVLENRDDGVEQRWHFQVPPGGDGDLLVAVAVSGHHEVRESRSGLHFLGAGQPGFSYSHATWVDARQTAWSVPVSWDGQQIVMRVPASVLERSAWPAVLDPVVGPEIRMDEPVAGFPGGEGRQPVVSRGGDNYLVVWTDGRNGSERETEIWASRVTSGGVPIDHRGIAVARTTVMEHEPAVTWTGSEWLIAWTREDTSNAAIAAATVDPTGAVTDLGFVVNGFAFESQPALASAGDGNALLAYTANLQIRAVRYAGGSFGTSFLISAQDVNEGFPTVAASGSNYLVAWVLGNAPGQDIWGRIVNLTGGNPPAFPISVEPERTTLLPSAAFDGTNYVLAWRDRTDIWGARVTTAGAVLDSTEGVGGVPLVATTTTQHDPAIECDSSQCLLAWADLRDATDPDDLTFDLIAQRFAFDLTPIGGEITIGNMLRNQFEAEVSTAGASSFLVAWADVRSGVPNIFASRVAAGGGVVTPNGELVNTARRNAQSKPDYAIGTTTHLATWSDSRNFGDDMMARRFDADGARLDDGALVLSDAQWDQSGGSVAFAGTQYVAAWRDTRITSGDIFAARMAEDGTLQDPAGIPITTAENGQNSPDVASDGTASLIVWQDQRNPANGYDLMGAILAADGSITAADIPICQMAEDQSRPAVAWDPSSGLYVVVWTDLRNAGSADIFAARVEPDGTVLDPCGVAITTEPTNWQTEADIAVSGSQLLVVWSDFRADFYGDIYGGRITVDAGGITRLDGDGAPIAEGASVQTSPTVVGVGLGRWGIAWTDSVNENTAGTDILGQTMLDDGSLEPAATLLSGGVYFEMMASFQSGGGDSNVVYLVYEYDRPSTGNLKVRRRTLTY